MINNRQNGRRRGRGGQQPRNGQPNNGSRVDNRARGNAAQLYEKYKTLARDAQMQGDRVNTEYYLQFSDHYFRVLSENRSRFDEQRRPREDGREEFGTEDEFEGQRGYLPQGTGDSWDDGDEIRGEAAPEPQFQQPQQQRDPQSRDSQPRDGQSREGQPRDGQTRDPQSRGDRRAYQPRGNGALASQNGAHSASSNGAVDAMTDGTAPAPERAASQATPSRIGADRIPPALMADNPAPAEQPEAAEADVPPKRRRGRKPRAESAAEPTAETQA